jgi:gliding motility-associated-like protein
MKNIFFLFSILITTNYFGQFANNPCSAGNLANSCVSNTISLTTAFSNSGIADPTIENGTGCSSVGSDATAGTITDYDGWYTTVADASGNISVYATIVSGDPVVGVYSGTCGSLTLLGCDDDGGSGLDANINLTGLTAGQTLFIRVWDYGGGTGTYEITSTGGTPPANDDCVNATGLSINSAPINGTTYCATQEALDWDDCQSITENNVWYSFTTPSNGDITVNLTAIACFGSGAGVDVSVFAGNCSAFTTNGCLAMSSGGSGSVPTFTGPAGTYYVMIDGDNDGSATALCDFDVDVDFTADPCAAGGSGTPVNDDCANAATLTENAAPISGTVYCATTEATDWNDCESNTENNVWYTFIATGNGNVNVNVFPNNCFDINTNLDVSIFTGNCASFSGVSCGTVGGGTNAISFVASIGTTYYIMVDGDNVTSTSNCDFNIDVDFSLSCPTAGYTDFDFGTGTGTLLSANNPYDCDTQTWLWGNDSTDSNGEITPGLMVVFDGLTLDGFSNSEASLNLYYDAGLGGGQTLYAGTGVGVFPNGPTGDFTLYTDHLDPTWTWYVEICDAWGDGSPSFSVEDIVTGAIIYPTTTADFDAIPGTGANECILYTIAPNSMANVVTWSISPTVNPNAFVPFPDGSAYLNTAFMVAGSYNITYTFDNGLGCNSSSTQTLIVGPAATAIYFSDSLCGDAANNASFNLTTLNNIVNGGTGQTVYWTDLAFTPVGSETVYTVNSSASPDSVIAVVEHGTSQCLAASLVELTVTESPTTNISPDPANICEGMPLTVSSNASGGTGGLTINWTGTGSGSLDNTSSSSPTFTNAVSGNYNLTATVTDNVGCTGNDILSITVDPLPTVTSAASVCVNSNITLTPNSGGTWISNDPSVATITNGGLVTGVAAGSTTFTFTNTTTNCSSTTNSVTVNPLPTATASNNGPVCLGTSLSLTGGSAGLSYSWSGPNTFSSAVQSPTVSASAAATMAGVYIITAMDGNSCSATATTTVTLNPLPIATATNNGPVCEGDALSLAGGATGLSYSWSGPSAYTNGTQSPTLSGAATTAMGGIYTITVTDGNLCAATAATTVIINALPTATAASNSPVCEGSSLILTGGTAGLSYSWSGPNTYTNGTQSPTVSASATSAMAGTYTITVTDGNICSATATTDVIVNSLPAATASNNGPVCDNSQLDLTGGAAGLSYSWSGPSAYTNGTQSPTVSANTTAAMGGIYTLTVTDGNTCTATATTTVTVNPLPTATASNNGPICEGTALSLTGGAAGLSYSWSGPNAFSNTSQSPSISSSATTSMSGIYTLTVTDANSCSTTATTNVAVNSLPTIDDSGISLTNPSSCGASDGSITGLVGSGSAPITYAWNGGTAQPSPDNTGIPSGSYNVVISDVTGCTNNYGPYSLSDPSSPPAPVTTLAPGPICMGGSVSISVDSPVGGATYTWSGPGGFSSAGTSITINPLSATDAGSYDVFATIAGCVGAGSVPNVIVVNPLPVADVLIPLTVDCNNPVIGLDGSNSEQGADITYLWTTTSALIGAINLDTAATSTAGNYGLLVTNTTTGCTNNTNVTVNENFDTPISNLTVNNGGLIDCINTSLTIDGSTSANQAGGTTGLTFNWSTTSGGSSIGSGTSLSVNSTGTYYLLVTETSSGCTSESSTIITQDANVPSANPGTSLDLDCNNITLTLDGTNSTGTSLSYAWSATLGGNIVSGATTDSPLIDAPGSYSLTVTASNGCTNTASILISEDITQPNVSVTSPLVVDCNNIIVNLDGSASSQGTSFAYNWTTATGTIIGLTTLDTAATSETGTYNLEVTDSNNGCTTNADIIVSVDTISPIAEAGTNVNFPCGVTSVTIDGSTSSGAGINFMWSGAGNITNGGTSIAGVEQTGFFYLTVTGANGCSSLDSVEVIPDSNLPAAAAGLDIVINCNNSLPVTLDGSASETGATITYLWSTSGTGNITGGSTTSPSVDNEGIYSIQVTNTANGCIANASVIISMDTLSPISVPGLDTTISCLNGGVTVLDGSSSTGSNLNFSWTTLNGNIVSQASPNADIELNGLYTLTVTASNGCTDAADVNVIMDTVTPSIAIPIIGSLNCNSANLTIDASTSISNGGIYLWTTSNGNIINGSNTDVVTVNQTGDYTLTITNSNGCTQTSLINVSGTPNPIADFNATPISGQIPLLVDYLDNSSGTGLTYYWTFGDGNTDTLSDPSNTFNTIGTFASILTITDSNGCSDSASIDITVGGDSYLNIPNIFSPNGDGNNDQFNLDGNNITEIHGLIMNRWGQVIYEWDGLKSGWDGYSIAGTEASEGTYYYIIDALGADGLIYNHTGNFQLVK